MLLSSFKPLKSIFSLAAIKAYNARSLTEFFIDPITGDPLYIGRIETYVNSNREIKLPLYKKVKGVLPGQYDFEELPNPSIFTTGGVLADEKGTPVLPYYVEVNEKAEPVSYYIKIFDRDGALKYEIEDFPEKAQAEDITATTAFSLINNGDYLFHSSLPDRLTDPKDLIVDNKTAIAYGGYALQYEGGLIERTEYYEFKRYSEVAFSTVAPARYKLRVYSKGSSTLITSKKITITQFNVNSILPTPFSYTFSTFLVSNAGPLTIPIYLVRYYGSGVETTLKNLLGNAEVTTEYKQFSFGFSLDSPSSSIVLGDKNDDYWQIQIELPLNVAYDIEHSQTRLHLGILIKLPWDVLDYSQDVAQITAGSLPVLSYSNDDVGLPLIVGSSGIQVDASSIGSLLYTFKKDPPMGYLRMEDDASIFTDSYSEDGVPYKRLHKVLCDISPLENLAFCGTGKQYVNTYVHENSKALRIVTNDPAYQVSIKKGPIAPPFTIYNPPSQIIDCGIDAYIYSYAQGLPDTTNIIFYPRAIGYVTAPAASSDIKIVINPQGAFTKQIAYMYFLSTLTTESYIVIDTATHLSLRFNVTLDAIDPVVTQGIVAVNILTGMSLQEQQAPFVDSLFSKRYSYLQLPTAFVITDMPEGASFYFTTAAGTFVFWYSIDGKGEEPIIVGIKIEIKLASTDTLLLVLNKTASAMNRLMFQVPSCNNMFFRSISKNFNSKLEFNRAQILSNPKEYWGPGNIQFTNNLSHVHELPTFLLNDDTSPQNDSNAPEQKKSFIITNTLSQKELKNNVATTTTLTEGTAEATPNNMSVNVFIKY